MKRILSSALIAAMLLTFSGCSGISEQPIAESSAISENSLLIVEPETGKPATQVVDTIPAQPETVAAAETTTESVTTAETDAPYDAGSLTEAEESLIVEATLDKDGVYTTKDDVALYIYTYGELPQNFITKKEAQKLGWNGGSLEPYAPGCCIGGSYFGNYEGRLPEKDGREYTECDIDTLGKKSRGAKRIVFSNDGLIYYTDDHYETFELLYGEE